jgi:hypothetical protein
MAVIIPIPLKAMAYFRGLKLAHREITGYLYRAVLMKDTALGIPLIPVREVNRPVIPFQGKTDFIVGNNGMGWYS